MSAKYNSGEIEVIIYLASPSSDNGMMNISQEQIAEYQADPDLFAARAHGLSLEDYCEWVEAEGIPLCGARTKNGHLCRNNPRGGIRFDAETWKRLHRNVTCHAHSGAPVDERSKPKLAIVKV